MFILAIIKSLLLFIKIFSSCIQVTVSYIKDTLRPKIKIFKSNALCSKNAVKYDKEKYTLISLE